MSRAKSFFLLTVAFLASSASPARAADGPAFGAGIKGVLGTWIPETYSERLRTVEKAEPPLNPAGLALYRARAAEHDAEQPQFDRTRWCAGPGVPRIMMLPYPFEIRADGEYIGFIYEWYRWHRMVDMSGAKADPVVPQTMGYPVGRWEGKTLVIETIGIAGETVLDGFGLPHSERMTLTERVRALPGGRLEVRFTIDDSEFYTRPWTAVMTYKHPRNAVIVDDVCPDRIAKGERAVRRALP
jgi:hypothetical protein